jgi:hypothetical protein
VCDARPMSSGAAGEWIEVNIPARAEERSRLLLEVVDPLVHEEVSDDLMTWFYFWEPDLRLRLRWSDPGVAESRRASVALFLDRARADGILEDWYEGNHGNRVGTYRGEADFYGSEVWELTARDWMSGSELALAIIRLEAEDTLTEPRDFHWKRRVHLFANQLWLNEIALCLVQAQGYLRMTEEADDPRVVEIMGAIDKFLRS